MAGHGPQVDHRPRVGSRLRHLQGIQVDRPAAWHREQGRPGQPRTAAPQHDAGSSQAPPGSGGPRRRGRRPDRRRAACPECHRRRGGRRGRRRRRPGPRQGRGHEDQGGRGRSIQPGPRRSVGMEVLRRGRRRRDRGQGVGKIPHRGQAPGQQAAPHPGNEEGHPGRKTSLPCPLRHEEQGQPRRSAGQARLDRRPGSPKRDAGRAESQEEAGRCRPQGPEEEGSPSPRRGTPDSRTGVPEEVRGGGRRQARPHVTQARAGQALQGREAGRPGQPQGEGLRGQAICPRQAGRQESQGSRRGHEAGPPDAAHDPDQE